MAHSTAATAAAATAGEVNYFYPDENGKILRVRKAIINNQEPMPLSSAAYSGTTASNVTSMGAYNQVNTANQPQFVRLQNYKEEPVDNSPYPVLMIQSSASGDRGNMAAMKYNDYNGAHSTAVKSEERFTNTKYIQNSNTKTKSKIHSTSSTHASVQRKRKPEKAGKGLRHFSMKVCEKVKEKGTTTYNEVADELVVEEMRNNSFDTANCDQKNIRRRVYDALNVLMAMQIISKDKKEIRWIGLPTNSVEQCSALEKENEERRERIKQKHQQLRELLMQQVAFKSLIERNKQAERQGIIPTPNSSIQLPFIIVNTHKTTKIHCSVTNDKSEYIFKFDDKFEMHDDAEVLKRMGLLFGLDKGQCSYKDIERAKMLVPPKFEKYIEAYGNGKGVAYDSDDEMPTCEELASDSQGFTRTDGSKTPDLDDEDEYLEHSDVD